ncbi:MAG: transposase [Saccharofermentanales bacterium]
MARFKHFNLPDRIIIHSMLSSHKNLGTIAGSMGRDRKSIVHEILSNRTFVFQGTSGKAANNCAKMKSCKRRGVCNICFKRRELCGYCGRCNEICPDYEQAQCQRINHAPFCCNGCTAIHNCTIKRYFYNAEKAHARATERLHDIRSGLSLTPAELERTDQIVTPLIRQGQSIHHIYLSHRNDLFCSEKSLYTWIDAGFLTARNLDLPRKPQRKLPRRKREFKVDRACRLNRTYNDYHAFLSEHPGIVATQMDSVVPCQEGHKVLLTLFWPQTQFLLILLRDFNTAHSVTDVYDQLDLLLGRNIFKQLFPVVLTDNGSEFSDPLSLERESRTRIFYCDPLHSNQKSQIERAHEFIRAVLPKGSSFDDLTPALCLLLCSHINSYMRDSLQGKSPYDAFAWLYGDDILRKLDIRKIDADEVNLTPRLLNKPH